MGDPEKRLRASRHEDPEWTKIIPPNSDYYDHSKIQIKNSFELLSDDESELLQQEKSDDIDIEPFIGVDSSDYEEKYDEISHQLYVCTFPKNDPLIPEEKSMNGESYDEYISQLLSCYEDLHVVEINGEQLLMSRTQGQILWNTAKRLEIENKTYDIYRTPSDGNCLFHSLVLVIAHWEGLRANLYRNYQQLRQIICKEMTTLNNKNEEWFSNLMKLLSDSKTKLSRKRYIANMKKDGTWGTRIEIIIFCLIYKCELLIGHSAENGTFKFDSTTVLLNW